MQSREGTLVLVELAARTGTTPEAIRCYERVGVLSPPERRVTVRYRRYRSDVGPERSCAEADQLARVHLAAVNEKLTQLTALKTELEHVIGNCQGGLAMADCRILLALGKSSITE